MSETEERPRARVDQALHKVWTASVSQPGYVKAEWIELEGAIEWWIMVGSALREETAKLRGLLSRLGDELARYGHHHYRCRYTPVQYDHVGTVQAGGNPCTCGFNDVFTALRAETDRLEPS